MKSVLIIFAVLFASAIVINGKETGVRKYNGYKVFSVAVKTEQQHSLLASLETNNDLGLDFWKDAKRGGNADVMVPPEKQQKFVELLKANGLDFEVKYEDVQSLIDEEKKLNDMARAKRLSGPNPQALDWESFPTYNEVVTYIRDLPSRSNLASLINYGRSHEGRNLYAVKISNNANNSKAIFVDANIHAREWITNTAATWIINELVINPNGKNYSSVLDGIDIYIVPVLNVDGLEFTHTNDRMWRKTRTPSNNTGCYGADPNRNFPVHFGGPSTSPNPCDYQLYHGAFPFSEPCTKALSDYVQKLLDDGVNVKAYISYHSYGLMWLLPWSHARGTYPPDHADQQSLGNAVASAIQSLHGTRYDVGTPADILYAVGGLSLDWAKTIGIKYAASPEMRGPSFIVPPSTIVPNAQEMMAALEQVAIRVRSEN